jgi:hypothetical protein
VSVRQCSGEYAGAAVNLAVNLVVALAADQRGEVVAEVLAEELEGVAIVGLGLQLVHAGSLAAGCASKPASFSQVEVMRGP